MPDYTNGLGQALGDTLATAEPLRMSGAVWYVNSATGTDAASPSGLDATSGKIYGVCVKAHTTLTFTFAKKGFKKGQGPQYTGEIIVVDIGIPKVLYKFCR